MSGAIHGWLLLDKPTGVTSGRAISLLKRRFHFSKVGHAGTLDPLASGVLPVAIGEATKTVPYIMALEKAYRFTVKWGEARSTDDMEGDVIAHSPVRPGQENIIHVLETFKGIIQQVPPKYAAIKIDGKAAYARARAGDEFEMQPRPTTIYDLNLVECLSQDESVFEVRCSKGTYVRSLARDLGVALGTQGCVSALRRTSVGRFKDKDTISLDHLLKIEYDCELRSYIKPIGQVLDDILAVQLDEDMASDLSRGRFLDAPDTLFENQIVYCHRDGVPIGIGYVCEGQIRPKRIFNC